MRSRLFFGIVLFANCLSALPLPGNAACGESSGSSLLATGKDSQSRPWLDRSLDADERAKALLSDMTLAEKIGQLWQQNGIGGGITGDPDNLVANSQLHELIREGQVGSILNEVDPKMVDALQRVAVERSRLGIPLVFARDVIHGFRTIFPIPLGQAASWDPNLIEQAAAVAAKESRSQGIHWTFAPMVDIVRDPRWGRIAESPGEDPHLASAMSVAMVRGFQGDDLAAPDRVAACVKHFACYGAAEGGRDYNTAIISPEQLHNVYLPPFRAAVDEGVATIMASFNEVNGIPSSANRYLFHDVLRKRWKFQGFVVSDWDSIQEMIDHGYVSNRKEAALAASTAGVNMEMVSPSYKNHLAELVSEDAVNESTVDQLVLEILRVKFKLGLFEKPYVQPSSPDVLLAEKHLQLARRFARQSAVLLKNENGLLPLDKGSLKKVALIGPLADARRDQLGTWTFDGRPEDSRTLLSALRESAGTETEILHEPALDGVLYNTTDRFATAIEAARQADVVVLALGESANISGEARSRAILDLPGAQNELVALVAALGKPVVLVVQAGRPLTIGKQIEQVDAVLYCFHAGTMAGPGLADLLWGVESPSGKLPVSFPKTVGQIPVYYNHKNTGRPHRSFNPEIDWKLNEEIGSDLRNRATFIDVGPFPLYPFGYGLSYSQFRYGDVQFSKNQIRPGQSVVCRVPVTNEGKRIAHEVVQLYIRDLVATVTRPVRELKGFRKVTVQPGDTTMVEFVLTSEDLAFFNNEGTKSLEPGIFEVFVGGDSLAPLVGKIEVSAQP